MAKKVTKKAAATKKTADKSEKVTNITTLVIAAVLLVAGGFIIGCACSAKIVYNSHNNEPAVNAVEPAK